MPLSISSFNRITPRGRWLSTWVATLILVASMIAGWEIMWRSFGLEPTSVRDTEMLWAKMRTRASEVGDNAVILVGDSRIQVGVNLQTLSQYADTYPVQLAIEGAPFIPVLENLANDDRVIGTIIVSVIEANLNPNLQNTRVTKYINAYRKISSNTYVTFYHNFERRLNTFLDTHLTFRAASVLPDQVFARLLDGERVFGEYISVLPDRSILADYSKIDAEKLLQQRITRHRIRSSATSLSDFQIWIEALEKNVRRIRERGGNVILVRFPSDKEIWHIDESLYPKTRYWERLAAYTSARTIHFKDYPELSRYSLPDGSHLDYRDAIPFTRSLAHIIFNEQ